MLKGILFDLDGTLLDIEIDEFLDRYFSALEVAVERLVGSRAGASDLMRAVMSGTSAMMKPHPGKTNQTAFVDSFLEITGIDLEKDRAVFDEFYRDVFPTLRGSLGPNTGAREAFAAARKCGLKVALATNPIFPRRAIEHRLAWAGFEAHEMDVITDYETMLACKPAPEYYRQTAEMLGVDPMDCIMVGDDRMLDLAAADVGMRTFYVGADAGVSASYVGNLSDLASLLERTCLGDGDRVSPCDA